MSADPRGSVKPRVEVICAVGESQALFVIRGGREGCFHFDLRAGPVFHLRKAETHCAFYSELTQPSTRGDKRVKKNDVCCVEVSHGNKRCKRFSLEGSSQG